VEDEECTPTNKAQEWGGCRKEVETGESKISVFSDVFSEKSTGRRTIRLNSGGMILNPKRRGDTRENWGGKRGGGGETDPFTSEYNGKEGSRFDY